VPVHVVGTGDDDRCDHVRGGGAGVRECSGASCWCPSMWSGLVIMTALWSDVVVAMTEHVRGRGDDRACDQGLVMITEYVVGTWCWCLSMWSGLGVGVRACGRAWCWCPSMWSGVVRAGARACGRAWCWCPSMWSGLVLVPEHVVGTGDDDRT